MHFYHPTYFSLTHDQVLRLKMGNKLTLNILRCQPSISIINQPLFVCYVTHATSEMSSIYYSFNSEQLMIKQYDACCRSHTHDQRFESP